MMMNGMGIMGFGFMGIYWILSALVLIAGVLLVIWAIVRMVRREGLRPEERQQDPAVRLLRERYARGEINREEYLERLRDLDN